MIRCTERDGIRVLRFEHGKVNAFDVELTEAFAAELARLEAEPPAALVITGAGRAFSAGVDLHRVLAGGSAYTDRLLRGLDAVFDRLLAAPYPLVAALNGHAIAGGFVVACGCDHRMMAAGRGRVGVPELAVGVPWPTAALELVRQAFAPQVVQELVYFGRTFEAAEALERGLVDALVPRDALLDRACAAARRLAAIPAAAFRSAKAQLRSAAVERVRTLGPARAEEVRRGWAAPETAAAIRAYLDATLGASGSRPAR